MPRGGRRKGTPGQSYPNRTDLPTAPDPGASTFKGQPYGAATAQAQVQASGVNAGGGAGTPPPPLAPTGPAPGSFGDFGRPTERPTEPVTHGAPMGPGAGPEVLPNAANTTLDTLRAAYRRYPSIALEQIIEEMQRAASAPS